MKNICSISLLLLFFCACEKNEFGPNAIEIPDSTYFVYKANQFNTSYCIYPYSYLIIDVSNMVQNTPHVWLPSGDTSTFYKISQPGQYQLSFQNLIMTFFIDTCPPPSFPPTAEMYVPNSFSPASDNHNDFFKPVPNLHVYNYALQIRDTEGILLYEEKKGDHLYFQGWDGTYQNTNMPTGFYLYYINYSTLTTENNILTGSLELIR
ncbi:MAG: hypothetical protein POELPBGB_02602 [Bacteroidia bacterium]|nr:hypothetical protein [Bacteroidia bacterium]